MGHLTPAIHADAMFNPRTTPLTVTQKQNYYYLFKNIYWIRGQVAKKIKHWVYDCKPKVKVHLEEFVWEITLEREHPASDGTRCHK